MTSLATFALRKSLVIAIGMVSLASGCGKSESDYIPSSHTAREALEAALKAWKEGSAADSIRLNEKPVSLVDSRWTSGKKLESYEIAEVPDSNPFPSFKVKMKLATDAAASETSYLVIGIDPLLIYRAEDYERERKSF
jgi:hypothetical protein